MLSSISSFVVGCIKKKFSLGFLSMSWKLVFVWIILESMFDASELKKVVKSCSFVIKESVKLYIVNTSSKKILVHLFHYI